MRGFIFYVRLSPMSLDVLFLFGFGGFTLELLLCVA